VLGKQQHLTAQLLQEAAVGVQVQLRVLVDQVGAGLVELALAVEPAVRQTRAVAAAAPLKALVLLEEMA